MQKIRFQEKVWRFVGTSRIRSTLLRPVGESGEAPVFVCNGPTTTSGAVIYIPSGRGKFSLYREEMVG